MPAAVSATLAANEALADRRRRGERVLPLAFGEAGLPVHPVLRAALAEAAGRGGYGPVAGLAGLREAAAGYWARRGLPTGPEMVVCGPGSKPLLYGLLLALGADVAVPRPSWVSYAAQAAMIGIRPHFVPTRPGEGGVPDPVLLDRAVAGARDRGRRIGSVVVTLPDNPTGTVASPTAVTQLCEVAAEHDLIIISDEIYRDLLHDPATPFTSPAAIAPRRTVVTTALSKSLALGGWRIGVARLPDAGCTVPSAAGLRDRLLGIGSEIWSAPCGPVQQAAAFAFGEPPEMTRQVAASRRLHAVVARAVAARFAAAGAAGPVPQAAFYLYPDFGPLRELLRGRHGVTSGPGLAALLLDRYGAGVLPASAFGEEPAALRLRVATGLLYGDSEAQRTAALASADPLAPADPLALPWISAALAEIEEMLADLTR
ncbi:MAG TPA: pyridoxal phosphate-dependent aminotransferase [Streptosporangiaceae bacterium]